MQQQQDQQKKKKKNSEITRVKMFTIFSLFSVNKQINLYSFVHLYIIYWCKMRKSHFSYRAKEKPYLLINLVEFTLLCHCILWLAFNPTKCMNFKLRYYLLLSNEFIRKIKKKTFFFFFFGILFLIQFELKTEVVILVWSYIKRFKNHTRYYLY